MNIIISDYLRLSVFPQLAIVHYCIESRKSTKMCPAPKRQRFSYIYVAPRAKSIDFQVFQLFRSHNRLVHGICPRVCLALFAPFDAFQIYWNIWCVRIGELTLETFSCVRYSSSHGRHININALHYIGRMTKSNCDEKWRMIQSIQSTGRYQASRTAEICHNNRYCTI